ncbi:Tim17/Tim22/Tim23/Pmp24 family-domain-containing protein [Blastocladiella britannica]|nr:Tim17/Tim22/Tim23/Pmp24 family-domain-containing protein [Blastocladiella britannica]
MSLAPAAANNTHSHSHHAHDSSSSEGTSVASILGSLDLSSAATTKSLSPVGQLGDGLEFVFTPDSAYVPASGGFVPSRSVTDDLCYGVGTVYLSGLASGGIWGLVQGLRTPLPVVSPKLRLNAVLNAMTRRGPFVGNSLGMLAMFYNSLNAGIAMQVPKDQAPIASVVAAAGAGALFKSTAGIASAARMGGVCGVLAMVWQATKTIREDLPLIGAISTRSFH